MFQHGCPHHCIPPGGMYFLNTSITYQKLVLKVKIEIPCCVVQNIAKVRCSTVSLQWTRKTRKQLITCI